MSLDSPPTTTQNQQLAMPNCLYVGTSKAGSTWIFDFLSRQPAVYAARGKGYYYFDSHFDRGIEWYLNHFSAAGDESVIIEISHSYLYSSIACERIANLNPDMKILVCLREPAERAFSDYLDHVKNGNFSGSFAEAIDAVPSIIDRGMYAKHLRPYLETFGRDQVHAAVFDDLAESPQFFADQILEFLEVPQATLSPAMTKKMMPAGRPRSRSLVSIAKKVSKRLKKVGLKPLMGKVKRSRTIRNALYQPYSDSNKPRLSDEERERTKTIFRAEIQVLDELLGTQLYQRWNYAKPE